MSFRRIIVVLMQVVLFLLLVSEHAEVINGFQIGSVRDVDNLETTFDTRLPSSFPQQEMLCARTAGFNNINLYNKATDKFDQPMGVGNWEIYARNYWWETRPAQGMECPVLPSCISAYSDWAHTIPCVFGDPFKAPKIIFVHTYMLPHFKESTLNFMNKSWEFILISGGTDATMPNNSLDSRFKKQNRGFPGYWDDLLKNPQVVHWYAENRDRWDHHKFSVLPTGVDDTGFKPENYPNASDLVPIHQRPLLVMVADRIRSGTGQWQARGDVANFCKSSPHFCIQPFEGVYQTGDGNGVAQKDFNSHVAGVSFVACTHGGGVDPSPKAFDTIRIGTIPIIQKLSIEEGYEHFPVAFVNNWDELFKHKDPEAVLRAWMYVLAPYYEHDGFLRKKALSRLTSSYWIGLMHKRLSNHSYFKTLSATEKVQVWNEQQLRARDHVMAVTIETANQMIKDYPHLFSSEADHFNSTGAPPLPPPQPVNHKYLRYLRQRRRRRLGEHR